MHSTDTIYIIVSDLNYDGGETAQEITRAQFFRLKRFDGRYLRERCSKARFDQVAFQETSKQYDAAIMKKYNVGSNYKDNRYFMEQVRPTLN